MLEELHRRNYAATTIRAYVRIIEDFTRYFRRAPDRLGSQHLRQYQAYLFTDRKLQPGTVQQHVSALRFFYVKTLKRRDLLDEIPQPKCPRRLPVILSPADVGAPDRRGAEPLPPHAAHDAVWDRGAARGTVPAARH
jgi:site-specific recombinase XerD